MRTDSTRLPPQEGSIAFDRAAAAAAVTAATARAAARFVSAGPPSDRPAKVPFKGVALVPTPTPDSGVPNNLQCAMCMA